MTCYIAPENGYVMHPIACFSIRHLHNRLATPNDYDGEYGKSSCVEGCRKYDSGIGSPG